MSAADSLASNGQPHRRGRARVSPAVAITVLISVGVGALSFLMRPSYDEFFWLAIARKVALGGHLYRDAIDNKTPFVYGLSWLLDALPGSYVLARSFLMAGLTAGVMLLVFELTRSKARRFRVLLATTATLTLVLQSQLVYTTELVAVSLLLAAIASALRDRQLASVALASIAAAFDPRSLLMMPGVVAIAWQHAGASEGRRTLLTALITITVGAGIVLAVPDLRFALVELNFASRPAPTPTLFLLSLFTALRSTLPFLMLWYVLRKRNRAPCLHHAEWTVLTGAVLLGALSIQPFDHYWGYVIVAVSLLWCEVTDADLHYPSTLALLALALVPLIAASVSLGIRRSTIEQHYEQVAEVLRLRNTSYASIDDLPYLAAMLPDLNRLRSPALSYLTWRSSRQWGYLDELPSLVGSADVLVEDGILSAPGSAVAEPYRPVWETFLRKLPEFPCSRAVGSLTLHVRCGASA